MYFQTSDDILNVVLAAVVAAVGAALLWLIVELIRIVRPARKLVETVEHKITRIDTALQRIVGFVPSLLDWVRGMATGAKKGKRR